MVTQRKFGAFFSARTTSVSSNGSARPSYDPVHQEPMFNGSDTSSLDDSTGPVSPTSEQPRQLVGGLLEKPAVGSEATIGIRSLDHGTGDISGAPIVA